jgi:putative ABC transport system permease protein
VLLVGAGLLIKNYTQLLKINPGLRTENVLTMFISLPSARYRELPQTSAFFEDLAARVGALPGVNSAAVIQNLPLSGGNFFFYIDVEGQPPRNPGEMLRAECHTISSDYFRALGIPLLKGRAFPERDTAEANQVIILGESMARRYFPNADPIGKKVQILANNQPPREIVGVVGDVKHRGLDQETLQEMYVPHTQFPMYGGVLLAHTAGDPLKMVGAIKERVWAIDKDQPVHRISTMERLLAETLAPQRFSTLLLSMFAATALLLASSGIYGVMSYAVSQSTREIGIRMALGAERRNILRLVVGQGMVLALAGIGIGVVGALALTHLMEKLLYGVSTTDPVTFITISLLLASVALLACYIPARRATKVDPMVALRYE